MIHSFSRPSPSEINAGTMRMGWKGVLDHSLSPYSVVSPTQHLAFVILETIWGLPSEPILPLPLLSTVVPMGRRYVRKHLTKVGHRARNLQWGVDAVVSIVRGLAIIVLIVVALSVVTRTVEARTAVTLAIDLAANLSVNCTVVVLIMSKKGRINWKTSTMGEIGVGVERG